MPEVVQSPKWLYMTPYPRAAFFIIGTAPDDFLFALAGTLAPRSIGLGVPGISTWQMHVRGAANE